MKILHAYNLHRNGGGSDNAALAVVSLLRELPDVEVAVFEKNSSDIPGNLKGKIIAATNSIYPAQSIAEFKKLLAEFKPDIVHAHELYPMISPWILQECKKENIKTVLTCYDYRFTCPIATHYRNDALCHDCITQGEIAAIKNNCRESHAESIIYASRNFIARKFSLFTDYVDHYIALSGFAAEWLHTKLDIDPDIISCIGCHVEPSNSPVDPTQGTYVAYAGRFAREKGVDVLLDAMKSVNYPLKLAGYEAQLPTISQTNVELIRTHNKTELENFYRNAKMLVVPSLWYETFGIVAAEAMAHGVPVIASDIGALAHTVQDNKSGLLFEMGNPNDLAVKINQLLSEPELLKNLGRGAYQQSQLEFSKHAIQTKLYELYAQLSGKC